MSKEYIDFIDRKSHVIGNYRCGSYKCSPEAYYALKSIKNRNNFKLYLLKRMYFNSNSTTVGAVYGHDVVNCTAIVILVICTPMVNIPCKMISLQRNRDAANNVHVLQVDKHECK